MKQTSKNYDILSKIANKYGYEFTSKSYCSSLQSTDRDFYSIGIYMRTDNDTMDILSSAIGFPGFGVLSLELEDKVYKNIISAKACSDEINAKIKEIEEIHNDY